MLLINNMKDNIIGKLLLEKNKQKNKHNSMCCFRVIIFWGWIIYYWLFLIMLTDSVDEGDKMFPQISHKILQSSFQTFLHDLRIHCHGM